MRRLAACALWICASAAASLYLAVSLDGDGRAVYLPGATTSGHHQIEERCELCHTAGDGVRQDACLGCHAEELAEADAPIEFLKIRMEDVLVTSDSSGGSGGEDRLTENYSLNYARIIFTYTGQDASGAPLPPIKAGFDFVNNVKI